MRGSWGQIHSVGCFEETLKEGRREAKAGREASARMDGRDCLDLLGCFVF